MFSSLLRNSFGERKHSSLQDFIEVSLCYNITSVRVYMYIMGKWNSRKAGTGTVTVTGTEAGKVRHDCRDGSWIRTCRRSALLVERGCERDVATSRYLAAVSHVRYCDGKIARDGFLAAKGERERTTLVVQQTD